MSLTRPGIAAPPPFPDFDWAGFSVQEDRDCAGATNTSDEPITQKCCPDKGICIPAEDFDLTACGKRWPAVREVLLWLRAACNALPKQRSPPAQRGCRHRKSCDCNKNAVV